MPYTAKLGNHRCLFEELQPMVRKSFIIVVLIVVLLVMVGTVFAITWGTPDGNAHPHVGAIMFLRPDGYQSCTGTLMTTTVILTAGHCVEEGGQENIKTWVSFDPVIHLEDEANYPSREAYLDANWLAVADVQAHPQFNDFLQFPNNYDVGVVILAQPYNPGVFGSLPQLGLLDSVARNRNQRNNRFTVVGYGDQGLLPPFAQSEFVRYQAEVRLVELNSTTTGDRQNAKFTNNPGNPSGGTCVGDSGGPVFYGNTTTVAAIASFGRTPCIGVEYHFRIDTTIAQSFLRQYIR
jgi:hypothetical protein